MLFAMHAMIAISAYATIVMHWGTDHDRDKVVTIRAGIGDKYWPSHGDHSDMSWPLSAPLLSTLLLPQ